MAVTGRDTSRGGLLPASLSRRFIAATERYIAYNPLKWALMHGSGSLRIHEPLFSPRLDPAEYWKGVGNLDLIGPDSKLVSLRVSRQVRGIASVVARMERAADRGFAIVSGFVSAGEQEVRDALCRPLPRGCCLNWLIFV